MSPSGRGGVANLKSVAASPPAAGNGQGKASENQPVTSGGEASRQADTTAGQAVSRSLNLAIAENQALGIAEVPEEPSNFDVRKEARATNV
jgi:hypothetical protein